MCVCVSVYVPRPAPFTDSVTQASTSVSITFFFFVAVLCVGWSVGFSLDLASGGYALAVVRGLLIAVASLVSEHMFRASAVGAPGSRVQAK